MASVHPFRLTALASSDPEADRTRALLIAADELLDEEGLEGLTIRAVLARTGLARRAFYDRFQGKDDLVLQVFAVSLRVAADYFRELTAACPGPSEALHVIVTNLVVGQLGLDRQGANRRGAALSREHLRLAQSRPEELQKALKPLLDLMADHVTDGIARGEFRKADAQTQARLIYNLVSNTVHTVLLAEEEGIDRADLHERETLAETLREFCRRGIAA
jgi:AcrR family transcriptional regulator